MKASALGVETVHQDLALAPHPDAVQNMFLGRELMKPGWAGRGIAVDGVQKATKALDGSAKDDVCTSSC